MAFTGFCDVIRAVNHSHIKVGELSRRLGQAAHDGHFQSDRGVVVINLEPRRTGRFILRAHRHTNPQATAAMAENLVFMGRLFTQCEILLLN
jgi:hypothetical protein